MKSPDLSGFVNVKGDPIHVDKNSPSFKAAAKTHAAQSSFHKGWLVEGFAPGFVALTAIKAIEDRANWDAMPWQEQAEARKKDSKAEPAVWNLEVWLARAKRTRLHKPFGVYEAALDCKELALKSGWTNVRVVEQSRGSVDEKLF